MARVAYTDLLCNFTINTTSFPTATVTGTLITNIYKQVYTEVYGVGHYSADDSTDTSTIINTDEMFAAIQNIITEMVDLWHLSGKTSPKPSFNLSREDKAEIRRLKFIKISESSGMVENIRLWNEDVDHMRVR